MRNSRGSAMMRDKLSQRGKAAELAKVMGVARARIHDWKAGSICPRRCSRDRLAQHLGIDQDAWEQSQ